MFLKKSCEKLIVLHNFSIKLVEPWKSYCSRTFIYSLVQYKCQFCTSLVQYKCQRSNSYLLEKVCQIKFQYFYFVSTVQVLCSTSVKDQIAICGRKFTKLNFFRHLSQFRQMFVSFHPIKEGSKNCRKPQLLSTKGSST